MNKINYLIMSLVLTGCMADVTEPPVSEEILVQQRPIYYGPFDNDHTRPCDAPSFMILYYVGGYKIVEIPRLCNPEHYIEKGDPVPYESEFNPSKILESKIIQY